MMNCSIPSVVSFLADVVLVGSLVLVLVVDLVSTNPLRMNGLVQPQNAPTSMRLNASLPLTMIQVCDSVGTSIVRKRLDVSISQPRNPEPEGYR